MKQRIICYLHSVLSISACVKELCVSEGIIGWLLRSCDAKNHLLQWDVRLN